MFLPPFTVVPPGTPSMVRGAAMRKTRETGAGRGGTAIGRSDEWGGRGCGYWGEAAGFVLRSMFSPRMIRKATYTSKMEVFVYWSRSFLVPFSIDQIGEAAGDKKSTASDGCG
jgi:hypothetical protein